MPTTAPAKPFLAAAVGFLLLAPLLIVLQRVYNTRDIEELIARADHYAKAESIDENLKGDDYTHLKSFQSDVTAALTRLGMEDPDAIGNSVLAQQFSKVDKASNGLTVEIGMDNVGDVKMNMAAIRDGLTYLKSVRDGFTNPHPEVVLSPYGQALTLEPGAPHQLPAANVSALGRVLYTDHLLAIELAGTLLLVATIGAIAIAGGRKEKTP